MKSPHLKNSIYIALYMTVTVDPFNGDGYCFMAQAYVVFMWWSVREPHVTVRPGMMGDGRSGQPWAKSNGAQRESRHLYTYLYYRFLHSLRSVEMTTKYFLVSLCLYNVWYNIECANILKLKLCRYTCILWKVIIFAADSMFKHIKSNSNYN